MEEHTQRAKATFHSTAKQAAQVALSLRAKALILGHFSARYPHLEDFVLEAKSIFPLLRSRRREKLGVFHYGLGRKVCRMAPRRVSPMNGELNDLLFQFCLENVVFCDNVNSVIAGLDDSSILQRPWPIR